MEEGGEVVICHRGEREGREVALEPMSFEVTTKNREWSLCCGGAGETLTWVNLV